MARNGSGTYSVPNSFTPSTVISSSAVNSNFTDAGNELTNSLAADGQTTMSAPIKAANGTALLPSYTFGTDLNTGIYRKGADSLGFATGGTEQAFIDAAGLLNLTNPLPRAAGGTAIYLATVLGGTANAVTVTTSIPAAASFTLAAKPLIVLTPTATNTGAATLNYNATGVLAVVKESSGGLIALSGGELINGVPALLFCDGAQYILLNRAPLFGTAANLASAGTTDLGTIGSHNVTVTGTTGITAFGSAANVNEPLYLVKFTGALTITHNAASLILPKGVNIATAAGDAAWMEYLGAGNWRMLEFMPGTLRPPSVQRFTAGAANYTPTPGTAYIRVRMVGGGGGGAGASANNGAAGGDTSFGAWTAIKGNGGAFNSGAPGTGGTGGVNGTGTLIARFDGGNGGGGGGVSASAYAGHGACSPFGGAGLGKQNGTGAGDAAKANTGSGGGGGATSAANAGSGGGAGEYVEFFVSQPGVIAYSVGALGAGGAAGGQAGGNGAAGIIIVEEYFA